MRFERWLYTWPLRLRSLVRRNDVERELDEELRDHVEQETAALVSRGLTASEARQAALRKFDGVERAKEACRDARRVAFFESLHQDVRFSLRTLANSPVFTGVAILTLAIGIGANTAIFSLVDGVLFRPLPFPSPERLVSVTGTYPKGAFTAMRERMRTLDVAAHAPDQAVNLTGDGEAVRLTGAAVSAELFDILGVRAAQGRTFRTGEDLAGQDQVVVLSHGLWRERFGSDPSIVGRSVTIDDVRRMVIGVMPADFEFPTGATALWVPLHRDRTNTIETWAGEFMPILGRLQRGATSAQASAEVQLFQQDVHKLFPWRMPETWNAGVSVVPLARGLAGDVFVRLLILLGAVALVLLVACANVANLTLARAVAREREIGIRAALGAAPRRIARQMVTESVVLGALGGAVGVIVAAQSLALVKLVVPADTPRLADVQMNWRVLAFAAAVSLVTGCMFGLAPVLHARRASLTKAMETGGRGSAGGVSDRLRSSLTIAEVALAVLLVVAAGLLVRTLWTLTHVDPGFRAEQVVTGRVTPGAPVCGEPARCLAFYRTLEEQIHAVPGVNQAAFVNTLPLSGAIAKRSLTLEAYEAPPTEREPLFWMNVVTPGYFGVMSIRLEAGRGFSEADRSGSPAVAIVTTATARRFWPGQSAIGKHVRFSGERDWRAIVGVVADVKGYDLARTTPEWIKGVVYVPYSPKATQEGGAIPSAMTLTIRTHGTEAQTGAMVRRFVSRTSADVVVSDVRTMQSVVSDSVSAPAATASLFAVFAGVALLLGSTGVYGVLSFLVSRRTRDIGIRLALGAQPRDVSWLVLKEGAKFAGVGIGLGTIAAFLMTRLLRTELHGVSALDPLTYGSVTLVVTLVTLAACYLPTRRAARVDPLIALRDG